ncbi:hypothetical protein ANN_16848 [Periplaneta americana]|uniref:Mos1 transposase HTH domain-containing protein n=1 Tax=Periplaneta americana TaxID=6978 RepID=A0ABQ8SSI1_PERAM|nr:hypothetical protein ANN_16848 [Periplaneta americana]
MRGCLGGVVGIALAFYDEIAGSIPVQVDGIVRNNRDSGATLTVECTLKQYASSSSRVKVVSLFLSEPRAVKMCTAITSPARCEVRSVIRFLVAKNCKASEIHRQLCEVYGPDVMSEGGVRQWCRMFKNGRTNIHDEERSGRLSIMNADLIRLVDERVRANRRFTMSELSEDFPQISRTLLNKVITEDLGYWKLSARWVPKLLSEEQKAQQMGAALFFLERYEREGDAFLDQIVTGVRLGCGMAIQNKRRSMLSSGVIFLHDNTRLHTACHTATKLQEFNWEVLDHPPYSPDLAPSNYNLFIHMKMWLGSKRFDNDEELKTSVVGEWGTCLLPGEECNSNQHWGLWTCTMEVNSLVKGDNAGEVSPGPSTESYLAFARVGLRENPGKNLNQVTCPTPEFEPGPPGFAARRADRYSTGVDWSVVLYGAETWTLQRNQEEKKKLVGSLAEKKLPTEGCTGRNDERKKSSGQKKISDDRRHYDIWIICRD